MHLFILRRKLCDLCGFLNKWKRWDWRTSSRHRAALVHWPFTAQIFTQHAPVQWHNSLVFETLLRNETRTRILKLTLRRRPTRLRLIPRNIPIEKWVECNDKSREGVSPTDIPASGKILEQLRFGPIWDESKSQKRKRNRWLKASSDPFLVFSSVVRAACFNSAQLCMLQRCRNNFFL